MGSRSSKNKWNKEGEKQKKCIIGLSLGRNDLKIEGNFQMGYHSKTDRKYGAVHENCKPLPTIPEYKELENGEEEENEEN